VLLHNILIWVECEGATTLHNIPKHYYSGGLGLGSLETENLDETS
jgi:hypothetical protein